jgi:hypothetical protein
MSDDKTVGKVEAGELVVKAGSVQVLTQVGAGKAYVDLARGEQVPSDISDEERDRLVTSGAIGKADDATYVAAARPVAGEVEPDEIPPNLLPGGSIDAILAWVGEDLARARVARDMEEKKGPKARAELLKALDGVKVSVETEPPTVPESYDRTVQPAAPAAEVGAAPDDTVDKAPDGAAGDANSAGAEPKPSTTASKSAASKTKS